MYLFTRGTKNYQSHPQSPKFTLQPPLIRKKIDPSKLNETHVHLIFLYLHF